MEAPARTPLRSGTLCTMIRLLWAALGMLLCVLPGCASDAGATQLVIEKDRYEHAFRITKDVLRRSHFELARVDARAGVITTRPATSAGLATPWIDHASTPSQALSGLINRERRIATIRFEAMEDDPDAMRQIVEVRLQRAHKPGRRVDSVSARQQTFAVDPLRNPGASRQGVALELEDAGADPLLAARIASAIKERLSQEETAGESSPESGERNEAAGGRTQPQFQGGSDALASLNHVNRRQ